MKKSSLAVFAFALLAAAAPFAALLAPPTAPAPLVRADDLSPAATPQPLPTVPPIDAAEETPAPDAALAAADITLYDADTGSERVVSVRDFLIGAAACEMPPSWNDNALLPRWQPATAMRWRWASRCRSTQPFVPVGQTQTF